MWPQVSKLDSSIEPKPAAQRWAPSAAISALKSATYS
jgi:hypothetical protein